MYGESGMLEGFVVVDQDDFPDPREATKVVGELAEVKFDVVFDLGKGAFVDE